MQTVFSNFALILFVLMIATGIIWVLDIFYYAKLRRSRVQQALVQAGEQIDDDTRIALKERILRRPLWIEYSGGFFPVILLVFLLRSFLFEPFKIPSTSMVPTLQVGDLILVNKFTYGIRLPLINKKIIELNNPQRGDVMVFRYPNQPSLDYIKRVIGVPGDKIAYINKRLTVNGKEVSYYPIADYLDEERLSYSKQYVEDLSGVSHKILNDERVPAFVVNPEFFPQRDLCTYDAQGVRCTVPAGHYFMMGDNRDNSQDSRYWGFVPDKNIVGKAFFIWMNLNNFPNNLGRIGSFQ